MKEEILAIMRKNGLHFNKSLGQNFLIDENVLENIIEGAEIAPSDVILEIGAGLGVLTTRLAKQAQKTVAIEFDKKLADFLSNNAPENVEIICGDVMKLDLIEIIKRTGASKIVANLPYYITSPIIMRILEEKIPIKCAVLMVQLEVAKRITAAPRSRDFGLLTLACQYHSEPRMLFNVPRNCFLPAPNVDSAVIRLDILPAPRVNAPKDPLFKLMKAAFSQRRKKAANSIAAALNIEKPLVSRALESIGKSENVRAEELSLEDWSALNRQLLNR